MKIKIVFFRSLAFFALATFSLYSCGADGCVTCEKKLASSTTTQEICNDDSGTGVKVHSVIIGIASDEVIPNTTVEAYKQTLIAQQYTCK